MRVCSVVFVVVIFLVLTPPVRGEITKNACSLLTPTDAQAALREAVGVARNEDRLVARDRGSFCRYRSGSGHSVGGKSVSLTLRYSETDLSGTIFGVGENLKSAGFRNVHKIEGIGSAAIWGSNSLLGRSQGELTVIQGKSVMLIIIIDGIANEREALDRSKIIVATAIRRL